jgi:hypothetical protein
LASLPVSISMVRPSPKSITFLITFKLIFFSL